MFDIFWMELNYDVSVALAGDLVCALTTSKLLRPGIVLYKSC